MNRTIKPLFAASVAIAAALGQAQAAAPDKPPHALISIYRIAPGKHVEFLKWMAAREAVDKEVGAPATQWYAHTDGDSWDYLAVAPAPNPAMDDKIEAALKKHGLTTGFKQSIEIRQYMSQHTDTLVVGPVSATDLVDAAAK